ncbi:dipeptide ABC transporter ATP-binding protein [Gordonia soli]|uniref:Putative ABC transporter ATP-binding protein n=1 Tax=Gordonia soli NBRC 108243 TaxID=1223545 RepID=M0QQF7_9ACTN|nr:ABC transporter ATP-binding protein [Gordonia soli]GAC70634.1 putative ABC transporter ATP-binding protein [Gordonia soli NBRC 108243]
MTTTAGEPAAAASDDLARGAPPVLRVRDLSVSFGSEAGRVDAVRGADFDIAPRSTLAVVGESGSGKSVTALAVMGLLPEAATVTGSVQLAGRELLGLDDRALSRIRGREVAMIFQDPLSALTPVYTVGAQIAEAIGVHRSVGRREAMREAVELLAAVGIADPARRAAAFPHELSGGMRQRVMIAMAIANDPALIIADEPTTALDVTVQAQILDLLASVRDRTDAALMLITHDLGVVAGTADDVVVMYAGRAVETADVDTTFTAPSMPYTIGLLGAVPRLGDTTVPLTAVPGTPPTFVDVADACPFVLRCPIAEDRCRESEPVLRDIADGHSVACIRADEIDAAGEINGVPVYPIRTGGLTRTVDTDSPVVLSVRDLRKEFALTSSVLRRKVGAVRAVTGVTFDIRAGETLAIVGESGSGKSTTLRELLEFSQPAGVVRIGDVDPATADRRRVRTLRRDVSMVFQDPGEALDPRFTAYDVVAEPLRALGLSRRDTEDRVTTLLRRVGLDPSHADRFPAAFSGGQRQRIAIARALATEPDLIVLDEPLSALDVSVQADVVTLLRELQEQTGVAYLVVAHDLSVIAHLADRVAVMYLGGFSEIGAVADVFGAPAHPYTRALLSAVPVPDPVVERRRVPIRLRGEPPAPTEQQVGCPFVSRCPLHPTLDPARRGRCIDEFPQLREVGTGHRSACHHTDLVLEESS